MTTPNPFVQPAKGEKFTPRDHPEWLGKLFIFWPTEIETVTFNPEDGPTTLVKADVAIVDLIDPQTGQPVALKGASVGGKALVPALKPSIGQQVLGRLAQTPAQGQKSGAYYLAEYTDADVQMGMQYIATHPREQFSQPQAQAPTPTAQPAQTQPQYAPQPAVAQPQQQVQVQPQAQPQAQAQAPMPQQQMAVPQPVQAINPETAALLTRNGVNIQGMDPGTAELIASTFRQQGQQ